MSNSVFTKQYFESFKSDIMNILAEVWGSGNSMIDYSFKNSTYFKIPSGRFVQIHKPVIETNFCFGYHTDYSGHECSDAESLRSKCASSEEYFLKENLKGFEQSLDYLKNKKNKLFFTNAYISGGHGVMVGVISEEELSRFYVAMKNNLCGEVNDEDREFIISCYEFEKEKFTKRLNTYLKRYGMSKIKSWTYWLDE